MWEWGAGILECTGRPHWKGKFEWRPKGRKGASHADTVKIIQAKEKAGPEVGACLAFYTISLKAAGTGVARARTIDSGTKLVMGALGEAQGEGESYICHYRDLGFYSKMRNHQVLSWTGLTSLKRPGCYVETRLKTASLEQYNVMDERWWWLIIK